MAEASLAAVWIATRWIKSREGNDEVREELTALRQTVSDMQERLDFTERMLAQVREKRELPPAH
ncbi:MAG TPA: hypothetical protein VGI83_02000 [Gemmatimonadales bacterium]